MIAQSIQNWLEQRGYRVHRRKLIHYILLTIQHHSIPISYLYIQPDGTIIFDHTRIINHTRVLASDPTLFQQLAERYDPHDS